MNQITNYIIEEKEFDAACPEECKRTVRTEGGSYGTADY